MKLHIYRRDTLERTLELTDHDLRIGRGVENDIVLEDSDRTVARFHAELRQEGDEFILSDLGSQHGTWVDGERIQRSAVTPGTTIAMGHFRLVIEDPGALPPLPQALMHEEPEEHADFVPAPVRGRGAATPNSAAAAASAYDYEPADGPEGSAGHVPSAAHAAAMAGAPAGVGAAPAAPSTSTSTRRPGSAAPTAKRRPGAVTIPRPILYAASLVVLVLVIGVPYVLRPGAPDDGAGERPAATPSPAAPETVPPAPATPSAPPVTVPVPGLSGSAGAGSAGSASTEAAASGATAVPKTSGDAPTGTRPAGGATARGSAANLAGVAKQLASGKAALSGGQYRAAIAAFEAILTIQPSHAEAPVLLAQAKAGIEKEAQQVAAAADALAAQGDFAGALREYERAQAIDPDLGAAATGMAAVRSKMKAAGDESFRRARQLEAVGRLQDAVLQYSRAVELLAEDDANGKAARERLDMLKRQP